MSTADTTALPAGHRIHEYAIERTLGGGGFGITYLARDANLDLPVAIKEYFPADVAGRGSDHSVSVRSGAAEAQQTYDWGLERFLDEARALATFRHPNIVRVLRYFRGNGTAYIVMEYESGLPLKRWVPQNAPLSRGAVLGLLQPLLEGLEQVHRGGFLHRDIKPDNIYVRGDNTPVLLDFGSARRVSGEQDMTNIVSPGFAPFEQYHSQGAQGPWSDIYSIGAVLYWMVTGKKPLEAAARVKSDAMLPASMVAEAAVFGEPLLKAIDWALQPEESKRPQSVAELRAALQGAQHAGDGERTGLPASGYAPPGASSGTSGGSPQRRNVLGTVLFMDLVGYSRRSVDDQAALKRVFTELTAKALRGLPEDGRIVIDTGDGAAICFMGDPEEALHSALLLRDLLGQRYGQHLSARIGLHLGPVRIISDLNNRQNVIGDGINVAQRVMDFAQPDQVLVSRAYYDVLSRITDDTTGMFRPLGQHEDKHGRLHEVYAVEAGQRSGTTRKEGPSTGYTATVPAQTRTLDEGALAQLEAELARHIGPLAPVLVRKASARAPSIERLREALAASIPDPKARELFLAGPAAPHPVTQPRTVPTGPTSRGSQPVSQPASRSAPGGISTSGRSAPSALDLTGDERTAIEQALGTFIGPMARMIARKEMAKAASLNDLVQGLSAQIDRREQREDFVKALRAALPRRSL